MHFHHQQIRQRKNKALILIQYVNSSEPLSFVFYKRYLKSIHDVKQRAKQEGVLRMHLKWPGNLILLRNSSRKLSRVSGSAIYQDTSLMDTDSDMPNSIYGPNHPRCSKSQNRMTNRLEIPEFEPSFGRSETSLQTFNKKVGEHALDSNEESRSFKDKKTISSTFSYSTGTKKKLLHVMTGHNANDIKLNVCNETLEKVRSTSSELVMGTLHESRTNEIRHLANTLSNGTSRPKVRRQGICFPIPKIHYKNGSIVDFHDNWLKAPLDEQSHVSCVSSLNLSDVDCDDSNCED